MCVASGKLGIDQKKYIYIKTIVFLVELVRSRLHVGKERERGVSVCNVARLTNQPAPARVSGRPDGAERQRNASAKCSWSVISPFPFIKLLTTKTIFPFFFLLLVSGNHF